MAYVTLTTTFMNHMRMRLTSIFIGIGAFSKSITKSVDYVGYHRCSGNIVEHRVLQGRDKTQSKARALEAELLVDNIRIFLILFC